MGQHRDTPAEDFVWSGSRYIWALSDGSRHLGHAVNQDVWHAYDGTHPNHEQNDCLYLGRFERLGDAKSAVERAVALKATIAVYPDEFEPLRAINTIERSEVLPRGAVEERQMSWQR